MAIGRSNFRVASLTHFKHYNLTTILITINLQQKSVLLQRIFKKCVSRRIHYRCNASLGVFFPPLSEACSLPASLPAPHSSRSFPTTGSQSCWLTYHMFQSCEPRTCDLFVTRRSHSLAIRSNATQKNAQSMSFFFSLSLLFAQPFTPFTVASVTIEDACADHFAPTSREISMFLTTRSMSSDKTQISIVQDGISQTIDSFTFCHSDKKMDFSVACILLLGCSTRSTVTTG